ncbi:cytochrome b-c1 complex subunit 7 [Acrasis kona]|uniref:Cytochrome b-c1 complex subunit 7 n=1 Tax=Acrasis kona TaxID=1008807 RepID=A0AAW2Z148_9EUKA
MLRPIITSNIKKAAAKLLNLSNIPQSEKLAAVNTLTKRGQFNVYEQFPVVQPWFKYTVIPEEELQWWELVEKKSMYWLRLKNRYPKYGLLADDIISNESPVVMEAVNRLPQEIRDARTRRISRATDLVVNMKLLPDTYWTTVEEDVAYLQPYIRWVESEFEEHDSETLLRNDAPIPFHLSIDHNKFENGQIFKQRFVD